MTANAIVFLFFWYIVMTPWYIFPSGMPQPGDFLVPIGLFIFLLKGGRIKFITVDARNFLLATSFFFLWISIVSLTNALTSGHIEIIIAAIFGLFNLMVVFVAVAATQDRMFSHEMMANALSASAVLVFLGLLLNFSGVSRQSAMFNNPNQLSYFSILTLGALIHVTPRSKVIRLRFLIPATMLVISNLVAASLSGYAALGLLVIAWALKASIFRLIALVFLGLVIAPFITQFFQLRAISHIAQIISNRVFFSLNDKLDGAIVERGYNRIFEFPHYLLFGAGEGGLSRFAIERAHELHSTFGTLLFSYGIIGLLLFLNILRLVGRGANLIEIILLAAPLMYSVTHHGFRFSSFWLFLVIVLTYKENQTIRLFLPRQRNPV